MKDQFIQRPFIRLILEISFLLAFEKEIAVDIFMCF